MSKHIDFDEGHLASFHYNSDPPLGIYEELQFPTQLSISSCSLIQFSMKYIGFKIYIASFNYLLVICLCLIYFSWHCRKHLRLVMWLLLSTVLITCYPCSDSPPTHPIHFSLFDHSKLEEFACVGEKNNKSFLYFLIRMLTGMKAKMLQMCTEKDNWPMIGSKNYCELFKNRQVVRHKL